MDKLDRYMTCRDVVLDYLKRNKVTALLNNIYERDVCICTAPDFLKCGCSRLMECNVD